MYNWREMNDVQQLDILKNRKLQKQPWHSPPHRKGDKTRYHITAACYEHKHIIGASSNRMLEFEETLINLADQYSEKMHCWVLLPNHYHILLKTDKIFELLKEFGCLHGRTSYNWNGEENSRGRKVWCNALEHAIKSERHFWATVNYIHNNPVRHGYIKHWQEWIFSNANDYLESIGKDKASNIWEKYDISKMGKDWDPPEL
jgi:REP-associated tyrosine transposase